MYQSSYEQLYSQNQALGTNNVSNNVSNNFAFRNKGTSIPYLDPMWRLVQSTWQNLESAGIWVPGHVCEVHPKLTSMRTALLTMGGAIPGQGILDCAEGGGKLNTSSSLSSWLWGRRDCDSVLTLELWTGILFPLSCVEPDCFITSTRKKRKMPHTTFLLIYKDSVLSLWFTDSKQPFPSHFD